jgi:hypothetical protein
VGRCFNIRFSDSTKRCADDPGETARRLMLAGYVELANRAVTGR